MPFESKQLEKGDRITYLQVLPYHGTVFKHGYVTEYPVEGDPLAIKIRLSGATEDLTTLLHNVRHGTIKKKKGEY